MSKTYLDQVKKAHDLAQGLKQNYDTVKAHGITMEQIDQLLQLTAEATQINDGVEQLRAQTSAQVKVANEKLAQVKAAWAPLRTIIKSNYDQYRWATFGIQDKR